MHYNVRKLLSGDKDIGKATQPKSIYADKFGRGLVIVIGGSEEYHGAPSLAAITAESIIASLRTGAGYAIAYVPRSVAAQVRSQSPAIIVRNLGNKRITLNDSIKSAVKHAESVVIGMGIGRETGALKAAAKIIDLCSSQGKKTVIDADAIRAIPYARKRLTLNCVVTPQDREFEFLSGDRPAKGIGKRIASAVKLSRKINAVVLLKGHDTVVTDGKRIKVNSAKTNALATMGTGDVLSGIIGGYCATGTGAFEAAVAGSYLHSRIGDALAGKMGNHIISTDIVDSIPSFLKRFDKTVR